MPTSYSPLLGLALPVTGELAGTWGDTVNNYITSYLDSSVAGTQTISGSQTAVTLSVTNGTTLTQVGSGATGSAQYSIINCTGNPASLLTITAPAASKTYLIINATSTSQSVKIVGAGPTTGVTLISGEKALVAWNGSDFIKVASSEVDGVSTISFGTTGLTPSTATSGAVTVAGTLATTNGGTGLTSFTANRVFYASSTSAIGQSANLTFDGTTLTANALTTTSTVTINGGTANGVAYLNGSKVLTTGSALTFDGTNLINTTGRVSASTDFRLGNQTYSRVAIGDGGGGFVGGYNITYNAGVVYDSTGSIAGIYNSNGGNIQFFAGGSAAGGSAAPEAMRLTSTGLGIGTSSPAYKLDVVGGPTGIRLKNQNATDNTAIRFAGNASNADLYLIGTNVGSNGTGANFQFYDLVAAETRLTIDSSGNLGIGTSSPAAKLDVSGTARVISYSTPASGAGVEIDYGAAGSGIGRLLAYDRTGATAKDMRYDALSHTWKVGASLATTAATLDSSGNLGLGVTPSAWSGSYTAMQIRSLSLFGSTSNSEASIGGNVFVNTSGQYAYRSSTVASLYQQVNGTHAWFTAASGTAGNAISFTQAMTLDASGSLAIGQTSSALQSGGTGITLYGSSNSEIKFLNSSTGSAATDGTALVTSSLDFQINNREAGAITFGTSNTERARITSGGNLLVGTTTNTYSSKIVSNDGITDFGTQYNVNLSGADYQFVQRGANRGFAFYVNAAGTVATLSSAGVWTDASDARYKENVQPTRYGLDAVMQLKPREYNLIGQSKKQVGFIAQEVLDVVPEVVDSVVNSITNEDRYTLSYGQMTAVLTKAIQELKAQNDELRARVAALETK